MVQYRKSALVAISFILLFSISLFLYSCGSNNPGSSASPKNTTNSAPKISAFGTTATGAYYLYIANSLNHNIGIYDPSTGTTSIFPTGGSYPVSIAINTVLNRLYVANSMSNNVSVFDLRTNTLIQNITVGFAPINLAIEPNTNKIYVFNGGGSGGTTCTVSVIDPITNTASKTINVGSIGGIVINPATHKAYITSKGSIFGQIYVLDTVTDTLLPPITFPSGQNPFGIAIAPTASRAYVTMTNTDEVGIIDTSNDSYAGAIPITLGKTKTGVIAAVPYSIAIHSGSNKAYVINKLSNTVSVLDLTKGSEIKALPVGSISGTVMTYSNNLIAIDTTTNRAYVSNTNSNDITVIDTTTDTVISPSIPAGVNPSGLAIALPFFNLPPASTTPPPPPATLVSLNIQPKTASISVGSIYPFVVSGIYSDQSSADMTSQATWSIGNPAVATASAPGIIVGVASGTTTITVSYGGFSDSASLSVSPKKPDKIVIASTTISIAPNETASFTAKAYYGTNTIDITQSASTSWKSANIAVASINNQGIATGKAEGVSDISATYDGLTSKVIRLTVSSPKLVKIDITPLDYSANSLSVVQYSAKGTFSDQSIKDITNGVDWSSSDTTVAQLTFLSPFLSLIPGGSGYQNVMGAFAVTGNGGTSTIITAASTTPNGLIQATTSLTVSGYHIRQNKHVPSSSLPDWVNQPYAREWFTYDIYDVNGNPIGTITIDLGARITLPYSIGQKGCHMVCAAMVLTKTTGKTVNPKLFNDWLNTQNPIGYDTGNGPVWSVVKQYPGSRIVSSWAFPVEIIDKKTKAVLWSKASSYASIDWALANSNMVVLHVTGALTSHYVLAIKGTQGDYYIYDPWHFTGDQDTQLDRLLNRYTFDQFNIITIQ